MIFLTIHLTYPFRINNRINQFLVYIFKNRYQSSACINILYRMV